MTKFLDLVSNARRVPLMDKIMLDENDLLNIIDDLKEAIPREIKSANQVLEEQKNIVDKAMLMPTVLCSRLRKRQSVL